MLDREMTESSSEKIFNWTHLEEGAGLTQEDLLTQGQQWNQEMIRVWSKIEAKLNQISDFFCWDENHIDGTHPRRIWMPDRILAEPLVTVSF